MSLLGLNGVLGGSWTKAGLVNSNKKKWGSGKIHRGLIHQGTGKGLGARSFEHEGCQGVISELTLICDAAGCYLGHALQGLMSVQGPSGHLATRNGCQGKDIVELS